MVLSRVELDPSGRAHCAWCDTLIEKGTPRVVRAFYHAPGAFSRDNGAAVGYNSGGLQDEFMHAQCAFQYDNNPKGQLAACVGGCGQQFLPLIRILSRFGKPGARCTPAVSSPLYYCMPCAKAFLQRHRSLLLGHVGVDQCSANVAWRSAGPFGGSKGGPPPLPKDRTLRETFRECFRFDPPQDADDEQRALRRHEALQAAICAALEADKHKDSAASPSARPAAPISLGKRPAAASACHEPHAAKHPKPDARPSEPP
jgi:hypothetical protein